MDNNQNPNQDQTIKPKVLVNDPQASTVSPAQPVSSQLPNTPVVNNPKVYGLSNEQSTPPLTNPPNSPSPQGFKFGEPGPPASSFANTNSSSKKKRFLFVVVIVFLVLLIIGGGGSFAYYTAMNNKPEKVLADALSNTIKDVLDRNPSSMIGYVKYEYKGEKKGSMNIEFNSKISGGNTQQEASLNLKSDEIDFTIKGAVITLSTNEVYVKFDDLKKLTEQSSKSNPDLATYVESFKPIIDKIDSKWIKIDKQSLVEFGFVESEDEVDKCTKALADLRVSKDDKKKLKKIFLENQFMIATEKLSKEKVDNESSYHYKLDFNEEKSIKFSKSITDLESFKGVKTDCKIKNEDYDKQLTELQNNAGREADQIKPVVELWVGTKTRLPTKIKITTNDETLTMEFNSKIKINDKSFKIEAPADSLNIKELKTEIESLFSNGNTGSSSLPTSAKDTMVKNAIASYMASIYEYSNNNNGAIPPNAKAVNEILEQSVQSGSNDFYYQQLIITDETPKDGDVQYKIKTECSGNEFVANEQTHLFAMRAKLSDGSFICLD